MGNGADTWALYHEDILPKEGLKDRKAAGAVFATFHQMQKALKTTREVEAVTQCVLDFTFDGRVHYNCRRSSSRHSIRELRAAAEGVASGLYHLLDPLTSLLAEVREGLQCAIREISRLEWEGASQTLSLYMRARQGVAIMSCYFDEVRRPEFLLEGMEIVEAAICDLEALQDQSRQKTA